MKSPQVAIIVVNWNRCKDTLACLASLSCLDYPAYTVIVVDNASRDDSVDRIRMAYPQTILIELEENLGFVGGNNIGMEYALEMGADYALLLNNDTEVAPNFLSELVIAAQTNDHVGIVGPTIYYFDRPNVIWSQGGEIDWSKGITSMIDIDKKDEGQFSDIPHAVDFVTGCSLMIKTSVIKEVGKLDERFFAYYEEVEWCVRVARAGYKLLQIPRAKVWHKISPERQVDSPIVHYYMTRNRLLFLQSSHANIFAWACTFSDFLRTLLSWTILPKWKHKSNQRKVMFLAIRDFFYGRFGKADIFGNIK